MARPAYRAPAPDPFGPRPLTLEEFFAFAEAAEGRYEYVAGYVYAMSSVTYRHSRIVSNGTIALANAARGGPCTVHASGVSVRTPRDRIYVPNVLVHCGPYPSEEADGGVFVEDPSVIVEVTSPSTARTDRTEKLDAYRTVASLRAYLIVDQGRRLVERYWRDEAGAWQEERVTEGSVAVPSPDVVLTLDEIYDGVRFDPPRRLRVGEQEVDAYYVAAAEGA